MREILFRAKIKNIDELIGKGFTIGGTVNPISKWVYGVPIPRYPDLFLAWSEGNGEYEEITVIPETIGQYTGLTDKNGVKIFERDIIKYSYRDINEKAIIRYGAPKERYTMYGWYLDDNHGNTAFLLSEFFIEFFDCVIIGNIYDNPELMGR